jgi:anaerobic ribonucleoside-triphosphate reductase activating protein
VSALLRTAHRVACTEAEGPYRRYALWVQGCSLRCPGCCNPALFDPAGGTATTVRSLQGDIERARDSLGIEGITVLGGEPLEQLAPVTELCAWAAAAGLGVLVFSGYTAAEARSRPNFSALWATLDTLVDGRFDAHALEPPASAGGRRFIGSANQRLHHRTPRYADAKLWRGDNHVELRVTADGRVSAHGFPRQVQRMLVQLRRH